VKSGVEIQIPIMSIYSMTFATAICLAAFHVATASAQTPPTACPKIKNQYSCDKPQFAQTLRDAKNVSVESQPFNKISEKALADLARDLGKTVQPHSADLIFVLGPPDPDGIYIGPNDRELATLHVYARGANGGQGQLLWIESYIGQPNVIWPMVVRGIIQQFKIEFK
jgi:hypothetical protein